MVKQRPTLGTALITGAAKRIGKAIALHCATLGYNIALHYHHSKKEAKLTEEEIKAQGVTCTLFSCDLSKSKQAGKLIEKTFKLCPDLNVLINNASIFEQSTIKESGISLLRKHFASNFDAPFILSSDFAKHCTKGQIINILDTHISQSATQHSTYLLSKKALQALTQMSSAEFAPNIRVNAVAPGLILPPEDKSADYLKRLAQKIPMQTKGHVHQIAGTVEFLLNSPYITGETIFVDGGEHLIKR